MNTLTSLFCTFFTLITAYLANWLCVKLGCTKGYEAMIMVLVLNTYKLNSNYLKLYNQFVLFLATLIEKTKPLENKK